MLNPGDIFHGVTPAPVRNYVADACKRLGPTQVIHPCVGRFGALGAMVAAGLEPGLHHASDLNLFSSVIGTLADPDEQLDALGLKPSDEVNWLFEAGRIDDRDFGARVLLGMKYVQLQPKNRHLAGLRREVRANVGEHLPTVRQRLNAMVDRISGLHYRVANLWDVLAELEADPPRAKTVLYMSMTWYANDFTKQLELAEEAFGWPGLHGREFNPEGLTELLERADAIPGLLVYAHCGSAVAHMVPETYRPVVAYEAGKDKKIDRLFVNGDVGRIHAPAPQRIRRPRDAALWDDSEITEASTLAVVPLDADTAHYVRDLYVHRLGTTLSDFYASLTIDGKIVAVYGLTLANVMLGTSNWIQEQFGIAVTSERYVRFNRLSPLALTSGETKALLEATVVKLQGREIAGIQSTDYRHYNDSKVKRGAFRGYKKEQLPNGLWKITTRGVFRDDTWNDCLKQWLKKWSPEAVAARKAAA